MLTDRRKFLKITKSMALLSIAAFSFGCSVKPLVQQNKKVALIYATKYGSTKDTASWIKEGIDRDIDLLNINDLSSFDDIKKYDYFIFGSGVWIDGVDKKMLDFLSIHENFLNDKIIASFIVCGTTKKDKSGERRIQTYFEKFHSKMAKKPSHNEYFGGRLIIDKLTKKDRVLLETFYARVLKREFKSWDKTEPKKAKLFGSTVKINWRKI